MSGSRAPAHLWWSRASSRIRFSVVRRVIDDTKFSSRTATMMLMATMPTSAVKDRKKMDTEVSMCPSGVVIACM